jgi:hypothetical protein
MKKIHIETYVCPPLSNFELKCYFLVTDRTMGLNHYDLSDINSKSQRHQAGWMTSLTHVLRFRVNIILSVLYSIQGFPTQQVTRNRAMNNDSNMKAET